MQYEIIAQPTYSALEVSLSPDDSIVAESGAMAWMTDTVRLSTSARGGVFRSLRRAALAGESFFQNVFEAEAPGGVICFAPGQPGDIVAVDVGEGDLMLEDGAFLASERGVAIDSSWQGLRGFFNEGLFILRATGNGTLFFNAYGDIQEIEVDGSYVVDNGHAVAWDATLDCHVTRSRSVRAFMFSDQLLMAFSGRGRLWVQSRSPQALADWVHPYRRVTYRTEEDEDEDRDREWTEEEENEDRDRR